MAQTKLNERQAASEMATDVELAIALATHTATDEHALYPKTIGDRPTFNIDAARADADILVFDADSEQWVEGIAHFGHGFPDRTKQESTDSVSLW